MMSFTRQQVDVFTKLQHAFFIPIHLVDKNHCMFKGPHVYHLPFWDNAFSLLLKGIG